MAIKFPTETTELLAVTGQDKLLVADNEDADASRDSTLDVLMLFIISELQGSNVGVPPPTAEHQMLVSDPSNNWILATSFNAGEY